VGHPLLDRADHVPDRLTFCDRNDLDPARPILAVFPGSRAQELRRHRRLFLAAAERLRTAFPDLQVAVARAPGLSYSGDDPPGVRLVEDGRALLRHARGALVKSGTTTLEAALEGVPFVVAYRTHPLTFALARRLVQVEHVALANLVAGERVVPELLQAEATPESLAAALEPLLREGPARARMEEALGGIRDRMGSAGAARRVAGLVEEVLLERGKAGKGKGRG
jgi:lipid-A-disaccharide synthase